MPCKIHSKIGKDLKKDLVIWRYMDLSKFLDLCSKKALYFNSLDQMSDPFEGEFPKSNKKKYEHEILERLKKETKSTVRINCWNISNDESLALWSAYVTGRGIAIKSTIQKLIKSFPADSENIELGKIQYIDFDTESLPTDNIFHLASRKRKFYSFENELRLFYQKNKSNDHKSMNSGKYIKVDLSLLIDQIVLSPNFGKRYEKLIKTILKKFDLETQREKVICSKLDERP